MNIVLIGYRGSGKSTIGKALADQLWLDFADTDRMVEAAAGKTIREIFAQSGEAGFRALESAAVQAAAQRDDRVIAAGGGVVLMPENVAALKRQGHLIWLRADPDVLYSRIQADRDTLATRPNLTVAGGLEEVRALLAAREPLYRNAADADLDVTRLSIKDAVYHITRLV